MAAGLWIWGEEWERSDSESLRTSAARCRCSGVPSQELNAAMNVISAGGYIYTKSEECP